MLSKVSKNFLEAFYTFCNKQEAYLLAWFITSALVILSAIVPVCLYALYSFGKTASFLVFMPISGVLFYGNVLLYLAEARITSIISYPFLSVTLYVLAVVFICIC
jgi:hypothetical protein